MIRCEQNKKSTKILLTENDSRKILLVRQQLPSQRTFQRSSSIRTPEKQVSKDTGVCTIGKRDELVRNGSEVIRCKTCGLVQYRTRTGNCRRCVRALPQRLEFLIPPPAPPEEAAAEPTPEKFVNQETVENIGQRIRQLRESRSMTQSQLQSRSKVSRSYLSRIESGQMTPSLARWRRSPRRSTSA